MQRKQDDRGFGIFATVHGLLEQAIGKTGGRRCRFGQLCKPLFQVGPQQSPIELGVHRAEHRLGRDCDQRVLPFDNVHVRQPRFAQYTFECAARVQDTMQRIGQDAHLRKNRAVHGQVFGVGRGEHEHAAGSKSPNSGRKKRARVAHMLENFRAEDEVVGLVDRGSVVEVGSLQIDAEHLASDLPEFRRFKARGLPPEGVGSEVDAEAEGAAHVHETPYTRGWNEKQRIHYQIYAGTLFDIQLEKLRRERVVRHFR